MFSVKFSGCLEAINLSTTTYEMCQQVIYFNAYVHCEIIVNTWLRSALVSENATFFSNLGNTSKSPMLSAKNIHTLPFVNDVTLFVIYKYFPVFCPRLLPLCLIFYPILFPSFPPFCSFAELYSHHQQ